MENSFFPAKTVLEGMPQSTVSQQKQKKNVNSTLWMHFLRTQSKVNNISTEKNHSLVKSN